MLTGTGDRQDPRGDTEERDALVDGGQGRSVAGVDLSDLGAVGLQPHRTEDFKPSPDPQLIDKVRDIVGLYLKSG